MNRRGFLGSLGTFVAALTLDPERLLWSPTKTIFIPKPVVKPQIRWSEIAGITHAGRLVTWDEIAEVYNSVHTTDRSYLEVKLKGYSNVTVHENLITRGTVPVVLG